MNKGIISVLSATAGVAAGVKITAKVLGQAVKKTQKMSDKHLALFMMMNQWVKVKQDGKKLADYFEKNGYKKIAIYGMSHAGETLVEELKGTGIQIAYGIDNNAHIVYSDFEVVTINDVLAEVDAVVVTAITFFDEIEEKLSQKVGCPILSLDDILYKI